MIQTLKLTKKHLTDPVHLLKSIGAVSKNENKAFPEKVYMNLKDYNLMRKLISQKLKKQKPWLHSKAIKNAVGLHLLNYGPVEVKKGIEKGYAIYIK